MLYTLQVYTLAAIIVFALTGLFLLGVIALNAAREYARAQLAMRRIASGIRRESFAISRTTSRTHEIHSMNAL